VTWSSGKLVGQSGANTVCRKMVAVEKPWGTTSPTIDDAYAENDRINFIYAATGDLVYGVLASGNNVAAGASLGLSATGGQVAALTVDATTLEGALIGWAEAAVDATSAAKRIKIRIA
jgi:hypothetical protein